jgi:hypothetical protein
MLMKRTIALTATLALLGTMALAAAAVARADQVVPMSWHPQTSMSGPVANGATATLVRRSDGVSFNVRTQELRRDHAYTVWFVVINNPGACASSPCSGPDIVLNPETDSQVTYGTGHISGASGRGGFAGAFRAGPIEGWLPGGGMWDPMSAEIQLVLNDHGPMLTTYMPEMVHTYRAGCTDASIPGIFPASARADGMPGPNACQLYQMAVFPGS